MARLLWQELDGKDPNPSAAVTLHGVSGRLVADRVQEGHVQHMHQGHRHRMPEINSAPLWCCYPQL